MVMYHRSKDKDGICILFSVRLSINNTEPWSMMHAILHRRVSSLAILDSTGPK